jgi:predicted Zn-dependent protease
MTSGQGAALARIAARCWAVPSIEWRRADMSFSLGDRAYRGEMTRRDFLGLLAAASASISVPLVSGCATHPVTGEQVLVGLSEEQEVAIDRGQSRHQFSRDYGAIQDEPLNAYVARVGGELSSRSHRPQMPYSYRVLNANYVNAYTFPAGSIAATRGIMLQLDNEAQLAALMGHEIGHVNARHSAQRAGQGMVAGIVASGIAIAASASERTAGIAPIVNVASQVGASALLASYSRENEREADSLGMEYMTKAGHSPEGMVGLMGVLVQQSKAKPGLLDTMFASHPMSSERYASMQADAKGRYAAFASAPLNRERYMDHTAQLRRLRPAIEDEQRGERLMASKKYGEADTAFASALRAAPHDYAGLCLMAKCQLAQRRYSEANAYVLQARQVYPGEAQAMQLAGITKLTLKQYPSALQEFSDYERTLPGDPNAAFFKGLSYEAMQNRQGAAQEYRRYVSAVRSGSQAQHAVGRLQAWGYVK